jgi:hypothetical protein
LSFKRQIKFISELAEFSEAQSPKNSSLEEMSACLHWFLTAKNIHLLEALRNDYYDNFSTRPITAFGMTD